MGSGAWDVCICPHLMICIIYEFFSMSLPHIVCLGSLEASSEAVSSDKSVICFHSLLGKKELKIPRVKNPYYPDMRAEWPQEPGWYQRPAACGIAMVGCVRDHTVKFLASYPKLPFILKVLLKLPVICLYMRAYECDWCLKRPEEGVSPWDWSSKWLWATVLVLEIEA